MKGYIIIKTTSDKNFEINGGSFPDVTETELATKKVFSDKKEASDAMEKLACEKYRELKKGWGKNYDNVEIEELGEKAYNVWVEDHNLTCYDNTVYCVRFQIEEVTYE